MPAKPPSRPKPDYLKPPKGTTGFEIAPLLIATIPDFKDSSTFIARFKSAE